MSSHAAFHRAQRPANAFIRWYETISIARPSGTRSHDHREFDAECSSSDAQNQSPKESSTYRARSWCKRNDDRRREGSHRNGECRDPAGKRSIRYPSSRQRSRSAVIERSRTHRLPRCVEAIRPNGMSCSRSTLATLRSTLANARITCHIPNSIGMPSRAMMSMLPATDTPVISAVNNVPNGSPRSRYPMLQSLSAGPRRRRIGGLAPSGRSGSWNVRLSVAKRLRCSWRSPCGWVMDRRVGRHDSLGDGIEDIETAGSASR